MPTVTVTNPTSFIRVQLLGRDGDGPISVPGLKVGDAVVVIAKDNRTVNPFQTTFELFVTVDDEIQQVHEGDISLHAFDLLLLRF